MYILKCEFCGNEKEYKFKSKANKYCSRKCASLSKLNKNMKTNTYNIKNNTIEFLLTSPKYGTQIGIIDIENEYLLKKYYWSGRLDKKSNNFYIETFINICGKTKRIHLHRLITNCPDGMEVDHINHKTLDNRKQNLKVCTHAENMKNIKLHKTNKTGYSGVHERKQKYKIKFTARCNNKYLGIYNTAKEANEAIVKYKG